MKTTKRIGACVFLLVFLFNLVGYYGLYLIVLNHLSVEFSEKVNAEEYSGSDAQIIKIPMTLPYQVNFDGYERAHGTFESNGEFFTIAKQRVVNDTLYVVLVKDKKEADLYKSINEFTKANSGDGSDTKSPLKMFKSSLSDFLLTHHQLQSKSSGWCVDQSMSNQYQPDIFEVPYQLLSPPPEV